MEQKVFKILLGVAAGAGARHIPNLIKALLEVKDERYKFEIRMVVTSNVTHFFNLTELPPSVLVYDENTEWAWKQVGDPVTHIELGNWADVLVIAPLTANTLGKIAVGICDTLLTTTVRAWDLANKPSLFCPATHPRMLHHPITQIHLNTLKSWGHKIIPPIFKVTLSGISGVGGLAEVETIVNEIKLACDGII